MLINFWFSLVNLPFMIGVSTKNSEEQRKLLSFSYRGENNYTTSKMYY